MAAKPLLPISLQLDGKTCLVVGGGAVAETRVRTLLACQGVVRLVSPQVTPWLAAMAQDGAIVWQQEVFHPEHLHAVAVVFVATDDRPTNAHIATLARQQHCLVNVADDPEFCDFFMPALVHRGSLTLAISTAGQAPAFAAWLRKRLERLLDHRLGHMLAYYATLRPVMKKRYPDMQVRARAWEQLLTDDPPPLFHPMAESSGAFLRESEVQCNHCHQPFKPSVSTNPSCASRISTAEAIHA